MTDPETSPTATEARRRALLWTGLVVVGWVGLALARTGVTFHLAPLVVALAPLAGHLAADGDRADARRLPFLGTVAALVVGMGLQVTGQLDGPWFVGGSALGETIIAAAVGGVVATVVLAARSD